MEKQKHLEWQAPEFVYHKKNIGWYFTLAALAILLMAFFIFVQSDIFAAITIGIIAIIIYVFSGIQPRTVSIQLNTKGIQIDHLLFPYKQLKHFWIVHSEHHQTVNFDTITYLNRTLIVQLDGQNPEEVRQFLLQHLPEHKETIPTLAQRVIHKLKF